METNNRNEFVRPAAAANALGISPSSLLRHMKAGRIGSLKTLGGHHRYSRCEIEELAEELKSKQLKKGTQKNAKPNTEQ